MKLKKKNASWLAKKEGKTMLRKSMKEVCNEYATSVALVTEVGRMLCISYILLLLLSCFVFREGDSN